MTTDISATTRDIAGYDFTVLDDSVAERDLFKSPTHSQASTTLHRLISRAQSGFTIGLEGSWGSGKSTVIHLTQRKFDDANKAVWKSPHSTRQKVDDTADKPVKSIFFLFDAWAHDDDALRRIFLESLAGHIRSAYSAHNKRAPAEATQPLKDISDTVSGKQRSIITTNNRQTSFLAKLLVVLALLTPIGSALLGKYDATKPPQPLLWGYHTNDSRLLLAGLLLLVLPLLAIALWATLRLLFPRRFSLEILSATSQETVRQDIVESADRSSIEFEKFFRQIIGHTIDKLGYDKIIIVIDNIDRVDSEHSRKIWSTMQTFFQHRSASSNGPESKIWFIIPYDREGFGAIWGEKNPAPGTPPAPLAPATTAPQNIDATAREAETPAPAAAHSASRKTASFLEKCFQVIVRVPRPVQSSRVDYFETCAREALTGWPGATEEQRQAGEADCIGQLVNAYHNYSLFLDSDHTAREVRSLINQIGVIGQQWGKDVPPEAACLYAMLHVRFTEDEIRQQLLDNRIPYALSDRSSQDHVEKYLPGLFFGVPEKHGMQLLLTPAIHAALRGQFKYKLHDLAMIHGEAFWVAFKAVYRILSPSSDHKYIYFRTFTESVCDLFQRHEDKEDNEISTLMEIWITASRRTYIATQDIVRTLESFEKTTKDKNKFNAFLKEISREITETISIDISAGSVKREDLINPRKTLDFCQRHEKIWPKIVYARPREWKLWTTVQGDANMFFPEIHPKTDIITAISKIAFADSQEADPEWIQSLQVTLRTCNNLDEWNTCTYLLLKWLENHQDKLLSIEAVTFTWSLIKNCPPDVTEKLQHYLKQRGFWEKIDTTSISNPRCLPELVQIIFGDNYESASELPIHIKEELRRRKNMT